MGVHLSNITSDVLEPLATVLGRLFEFVPTEDLLNQVHKHNKDVAMGILKVHYGVDDPGSMLVMLAADCVAMFPSMEKETTSRIIADLFLTSNIEVGVFSYKEASRYVCLSCSDKEIRDAGLMELMPVRRFKKGPQAWDEFEGCDK